MASEQWDQNGQYSQSTSANSLFKDDKEANHYDNKQAPTPRWRRLFSSKIFWFIIVMAIFLLALVLGLSLGLTHGKKHGGRKGKSPAAVNPSTPPPAQVLGDKVDLGYSTVQGLNYPGGISQWLGVRYAQPPLGPLRFAAPEPVKPNSTVQMATQVSFLYLELM